jgi:hypothetical protein
MDEQTDRNIVTEMNRWTNIQTDRHRNKLRDNCIYRNVDRLMYEQTNRYIEREFMDVETKEVEKDKKTDR